MFEADIPALEPQCASAVTVSVRAWRPKPGRKILNARRARGRKSLSA